MRCRTGIVRNAKRVTIPDLRCTAAALRRVRETERTLHGPTSASLAAQNNDGWSFAFLRFAGAAALPAASPSFGAEAGAGAISSGASLAARLTALETS